MVKLQTTLKRLLLTVGILLLGTLVACGGGGGGVSVGDSGGGGVAVAGGGGSGAAPGDGGAATPTAVEIPALDTVSDLPYITGVVAGGSFSVSSLKSVRATKAILTVGDPFSSLPHNAATAVACETGLQWRMMLDGSMRSDINLCTTKVAGTQASAAGINLYDGAVHYYEVINPGSGPSKFKVQFTKDSTVGITGYQAFGCYADASQASYQNYAISGSSITIAAKGYDPIKNIPRSNMSLVGTINAVESTQYDTKVVSYQFSGNSVAAAAHGSMTQTATHMLLNSRAWYGGIPWIYASTDLTNPSGDDPHFYELGAGAGTLTAYGTAMTACWNNALSSVECLAGDYNYDAISGGGTIPTAYDGDPATFTFTGSEASDCVGTAEFTVDNNSAAMTTCIQNFTIDDLGYTVDCADYYPDWLVNVTIDHTASADNGDTLSTNPASPTVFVTETSPEFIISANQSPDQSTFNSSTIVLTRLTPAEDADWLWLRDTAFWGNDIGHTWINDHEYSFAPPTINMSQVQTFSLTIKGGGGGVKNQSAGTLPGDITYYFNVEYGAGGGGGR